MDEIRDVLGNQAAEFIEAYGVRRGGTWEGKKILESTGTLEQREKLTGARAKLFRVREARVHPGRDEKVMQPMMAQYPLGLGQWLQTLGYALSNPREIATGNRMIEQPHAKHRDASDKEPGWFACRPP